MSENWLIKKLRVGLDPTLESQRMLQAIRDRLFLLFEWKEGINIEIDHHLTLNFLTNINSVQAQEILTTYNNIRNNYSHKQTIDPNLPNDDTIHKIQTRNSFVNNNRYLTLVPHNANSIYKEFILNPEIRPHITLFNTNNSEEIPESIMIEIKKIRDEIIAGRQLYCDVRKLHFKF